MKIWKRNLVIGAVMLFVCAGVYLNWMKDKETPLLTETLNRDLVMGEDTMVMAQEELAEAAMVDTALESLNTVSGEEYFAQMRLTRQQARDSAVELLCQFFKNSRFRFQLQNLGVKLIQHFLVCRVFAFPEKIIAQRG